MAEHGEREEKGGRFMENFLNGPGRWAAVAAIVVAGGIGIWTWQSGSEARHARGLYRQAMQLIDEGNTSTGIEALEELGNQYPFSEWADDALWGIGQAQEAAGSVQEAQATYEGLLVMYPNSTYVADVAGRMEYFAQLGSEDSATQEAARADDVIYEVKLGDTLSRIARQYDTTVEAIQRINGLSGVTIYPKQELRILVERSVEARTP